MSMIGRSESAFSSHRASKRFRDLESFNQDGLIIARFKGRRVWQLPLRQLLYFMIAVFSFKIFLFFEMGAVAYAQKIEDLSKGIIVERIAAKAMVLDPMSKWVIDGIRFGHW